jgi:putative DNA primase/helicase
VVNEAAVQQLRSGLPEELRSLPRFMVYRLTPRYNGRAGKVPQRMVAGHLRPTSPLSERAWLSLNDALGLLQEGHGDGLGLALRPDARLVAVDLDGVVAGQGVTPAAAALVNELQSFTEVSVSQQGLHVLVHGILPGSRRRTAALELIDTGFLALTGDRWPGTRPDLPGRQLQLDRLYRSAFPAAAPAASAAPLRTLSDDALVQRLLQARNGHRVRALLLEGRIDGFPTPSEADFGLARLIGWATDDPEQIIRLMYSSPLCRPERWAQGAYLQRTVQRALALGYPSRHHSPQGVL